MNKTTVTHTPTPWKAQEMMGGDYVHIRPEQDDDLFTIAKVSGFTLPEARANAAHIVRCVNAHAALVEALQSFLVRMDRCGGYDDDCFYYAKTAAYELEEPIRLAKAALFLAKGAP